MSSDGLPLDTSNERYRPVKALLVLLLVLFLGGSHPALATDFGETCGYPIPDDPDSQKAFIAAVRYQRSVKYCRKNVAGERCTGDVLHMGWQQRRETEEYYAVA
jgi:hypothetical protein